jgi:hypothetical protein
MTKVMLDFIKNIIYELFTGNWEHWNFLTWLCVNISMVLLITVVSYGLNYIQYILMDRDEVFKPTIFYNGPEVGPSDSKKFAGCLTFASVLSSCFKQYSLFLLAYIFVLMVIDNLGTIEDCIRVRIAKKRGEPTGAAAARAVVVEDYENIQAARKEKGLNMFPSFEYYKEYLLKHYSDNIDLFNDELDFN